MSGFGGFGAAPAGGGLFGGDKPPEQSSGGFTLPTTTVVTTTTGLSFGAPTFGTGGTGTTGGLFGAQQQTPSFDTSFGAKPATTGTGFNFNPTATSTTAPTFGSTMPSFGTTPSTTASGFNIPTANTSLPTFGSFGTTNTSTFGSFGTTNTSTFGTTTLGLNTPKTTGVTGFTAPTTSTTTPATFGFGVPAPTTTTSGLTFGVQTTSATSAPSTAPTLSFGISTAATTTAAQTTGFSLSQPTTTSLNFGAPKTTKTLTFGTGTAGFNTSTTAAPTFNLGTVTTTAPSLGTGLFCAPKTTEVPGTTTTSVGLGGVDNKQTTQGLSGSGNVEPKQAKDHTLPEPILQTLNEFQNFTKQQKSLSVEISHGSSKPLKKVQEDTEAMESLLTMITSGLTRNAIAVDKLKTETAQGLHQAEMAQRNHETPPGLDYDNSASADYFNDLVTKFETDTVRLRVQIEASEKHLRSLTQSSIISPQELTLAMRRLHETLIVLAARVQALHTSVQSQKEQFKNLRRVYFKDDTNIFENDTEQTLVKKQTIYSLRSLTGPTPFSENPAAGPSLNVDGLAMLACSTGASIPSTSANTTTLFQRATHAAFKAALQWIDWREDGNEFDETTVRGDFSTGCMPTEPSLALPAEQPVGNQEFQLPTPPTGNKRTRH